MKHSLRTLLVLGLVLGTAAVSLIAQTPVTSTPFTDGLIRTSFLNMGVQPRAFGDVQFNASSRQTSLIVSTAGLTPGVFDVAMNGTMMDRLVVNRRGTGTMLRRALAGSLFRLDPRGTELSISQTGTTLLMARVPTSAAATRSLTRIEDTFTNVGGTTGTANAILTERAGLMNMQVSVAQPTTGTLMLMADGVQVGTVTVGTSGIGTTTFDSRPFSSGFNLGAERLLTFDPRGSILTLNRDEVEVFRTTFPQFAD
jgi:hypothetical protein